MENTEKDIEMKNTQTEKNDEDKALNEDIQIDDDEDIDYEALEREAMENQLDFEIVEDGGDDIYYDDEMINEEMKDETFEEESFKNDIDYKKMLDLKNSISSVVYPEFEAEGEIYSVALDEKNGKIIVGDGEEFMYLVDANTGKCLEKEKLHKDSIISIKLSFDGSLLLTASMDGSLKIFSVPEYKLLHHIEEGTEEIMVSIILSSFSGLIGIQKETYLPVEILLDLYLYITLRKVKI